VAHFLSFTNLPTAQDISRNCQISRGINSLWRTLGVGKSEYFFQNISSSSMKKTGKNNNNKTLRWLKALKLWQDGK
jgi:hypothetical protein